MNRKLLVTGIILLSAITLSGCSLIPITSQTQQTTSHSDTSSTTSNNQQSTSDITTTESYRVSFDSLGGSQIESLVVVKGNTIDLPIPTLEGYSFQGWYTGTSVNDAQFTVLSIVTRDITLYAKWSVNEYNITFFDSEGFILLSSTLEYGSVITYPSISKTGHVLDGWYLTNSITTKFTYLTMPAQNISLSPKWTPNEYTVTYYNGDNTTVLYRENVPYGSASQFNGDQPTKESTDEYDFIFSGWSAIPNSITQNLDIYAVFSPVESHNHFSERVRQYIQSQVHEVEFVSFELETSLDGIELIITSSNPSFANITQLETLHTAIVAITRPYIPGGGHDEAIYLSISFVYRELQQTVTVSFNILAEQRFTPYASISDVYLLAAFDDYIRINGIVDFVFLHSFIALDDAGQHFFVNCHEDLVSQLSVGMNISIKGYYRSDLEVDQDGVVELVSYSLNDAPITVPTISKITDYPSEWVFGNVYHRDWGITRTTNGLIIGSQVNPLGTISNDMTESSEMYLERITSSSNIQIPLIFVGYDQDTGLPIFHFDTLLNNPYLGMTFIDIASNLEYFDINNIELPDSILSGFYVISSGTNGSFTPYLLPSDILVGINDITILNVDQLVTQIVPTLRIGRVVTLTVFRNSTYIIIENVLLITRVLG